MNDNRVTEEELKLKATGRRVTLEDVHEAIASEHYFTAAQGNAAAQAQIQIESGSLTFATKPAPEALGLLTFCTLVLTNGFTVVGQSACADPANYNREIGERIAKADAINKIWPLLGFQLREDMARDQDLLNGRAFGALAGFAPYVGTKIVHAIPMTRAIYNDLRGWTMPENENDDEGYLVEYTDGGQANVEGFAGYISWSPSEVFERSYRAVGPVVGAAGETTPGPEGAGARGRKKEKKENAWAERLLAERRELSERCGKLANYIGSESFSFLPRVEQSDLTEQKRYMDGYLMILNYRVSRLPGLSDSD